MFNAKYDIMKTRIFTLLSVALLWFGSGLFELANAQSLRIVYDFIQDDIHYYRTKPGDPIGKEISSPIVGRNKMVTVEVKNFNNFVYTANATYVSKKVEEGSDMSLMNIITPLVAPGTSGVFFSSLGGTLPDEVGRGGLLSTFDASEAYDDMQAAYAEFQSIESNLKTMEYAIRKLNKLRYNPYLPTDTIVQISDHLIEMIFNKSTVNPTDFTDAILSYNNRIGVATSTFNKASGRFLQAYAEYDSMTEGSFEGQGLDRSVATFRSQINNAATQIDPEYIAERIDVLESIYTSIKTTSFSFNSSHAAKDDQLDLIMSFYLNPATSDSSGAAMANMNNLDALSKVKDKKINVIVRGDLKINTSVGLGFPNFGTNQEFVNRDSVITAQSGSSYAPNLAAYVNFFPYTGRVANFGGSFGIGVPLNDKTRSVNMMLGGMALLGTDNRVALHAGVTLGQVSVLDQGYTEGDKLLTANQEVPLRNNWEWGTFVGISFSLQRGSTD